MVGDNSRETSEEAVKLIQAGGGGVWIMVEVIRASGIGDPDGG